MTNLNEFIEVLSATESLLLRSKEIGWAEAMRCVKECAGVDVEVAKRKLLQMFGGMGSFNDLVLQSKGQLLSKENDHLNELRDKLFDLSREP